MTKCPVQYLARELRRTRWRTTPVKEMGRRRLTIVVNTHIQDHGAEPAFKYKPHASHAQEPQRDKRKPLVHSTPNQTMKNGICTKQGSSPSRQMACVCITAYMQHVIQIGWDTETKAAWPSTPKRKKQMRPEHRR